MTNVLFKFILSNLSSPQKRRGYTLIEILVGMTIFALVFLLGFAAYREFARRQALVSLARQMRGEIRLAQELALAGKKPAMGCGVLNGYYFFVDPPDQYYIEAVCDAGSTSDEKVVDLPQGFTISGLVPDVIPKNSILFKALGAGTNIPDSTSTTITITQTDTGNTAVVTVTSGGEVR